MAITKEQVIEVCKHYEDPELGIDVWSLGLIYQIDIVDENTVHLKITFTSPTCPFGPEMIEDLKQMIKYKGATKVDIDVVFDPPWKPTDELRDMLGM
ncbi:aromatic ring hydroxylase [archaeon]|nr:aromatic ring hydroxylase [archaeon]|tara:strand:- start:426 stop:716 length:291 start_codon:yes stop_codon:yes gene_type:complete